jgi:hypothetical protein
MVDQLFDELGGVSTAGKMLNVVKHYAGNVLAGFAVPFQNLKDVVAQFDREERIVRDTREAPLTGPTLSRIPFAGRGLPEVQSTAMRSLSRRSVTTGLAAAVTTIPAWHFLLPRAAITLRGSSITRASSKKPWATPIAWRSKC